MINLIGISGYINSGKDTVGEIINSLCKEEYRYFSWEIKKFAAKLKQVASLLTGISVERFEDQEFKKTFLPREWDYVVAKAGKRQDRLWGSGEKEIKQYEIRLFLQKLGTEAIRDNIHKNTWVNALFTDYKGKPDPKEGVIYYADRFQIKKTEELITPESHPHLFGEWFPYWIITDVRFENEAQAIKDRGGIIVRVRRPVEKGSPYESNRWQHPSELSLDKWDFDYTIQNNGSIEELVERVREMLIHYKIIRNGEANTE